jgi:hypothetical protein
MIVGGPTSRRVGTAGCPAAPLTEPDLWTAHPALRIDILGVKEHSLTRDRPGRFLPRRWRGPSLSWASLSAAATSSPRIRPGFRRRRPPSGCRQTRSSIGAPSHLSIRHPLRSTGVTRLHRYYGVIRLLGRHRQRVVACAPPTAVCGSAKASWGKDEPRPATTVPSTVPPRLDIGLRIDGHAHPGRAGLTGLHLRSVPRFPSGFHSTRPHGCDPRLHPHGAAGLAQLPPGHGCLQCGSVGDFHPECLVHAQRTRAAAPRRRARSGPYAPSPWCGADNPPRYESRSRQGPLV